MEKIFIVPFPIHHPERWQHYVPPGTRMFVVVYSPWERRKAERLREAGIEVVALDSFQKGISGEQIRALLASGGDWEDMVPDPVARFLRLKLKNDR